MKAKKTVKKKTSKQAITTKPNVYLSKKEVPLRFPSKSQDEIEAQRKLQVKHNESGQEAYVHLFQFKNISDNFEKLEILLFDYNKQNKDIKIKSNTLSLEEFRIVHKDLSNLVGISITTEGVDNLMQKNLTDNSITMLSKSKSGVVENSAPLIFKDYFNIFQFQSNKIEIRELPIFFRKGFLHDIKFYVYPDTSINVMLHFGKNILK